MVVPRPLPLLCRLPDGLSCAACTLQWWWTTGNSCVPPGSPFGGNSGVCGGDGAYPEEVSHRWGLVGQPFALPMGSWV